MWSRASTGCSMVCMCGVGHGSGEGVYVAIVWLHCMDSRPCSTCYVLHRTAVTVALIIIILMNCRYILSLVYYYSYSYVPPAIITSWFPSPSSQSAPPVPWMVVAAPIINRCWTDVSPSASHCSWTTSVATCKKLTISDCWSETCGVKGANQPIHWQT